ncbi:hypothetical protein ABL78_6639 [Leptomonas seymouri]|uniref:Membrane-associated protein n=1 Tax=Leptomonas seymouri TaxID=5684 RepID=A0A0N0P3M3_LEPSE|nr:hypothetical protein ABL78_6639 [Leptomonas seymouri]|eukprot:KPI84296.1 hypothetical protein ABL78_6639 [Leptomonas seymouri]
MASRSKRMADKGCRRLAFVLVVTALLLEYVPQAAALSGRQVCPVSTSAAAMSAWCTARFGGRGGTLTASAWDRGRQSFSCICNANADAAMQITRVAAFQQLTDDEMVSESLSSSDNSSSHLTLENRSSISSSSSNPVVTGMCSWMGAFTPYPDGVQCMATTGVCPSSCSVMPPNLCNNAVAKSEICTEAGAYNVFYSCQTCNGRNYTIHSISVSSCTRHYTEADRCDAQAACSGHGCCVGRGAACVCYSDSVNGFYTGSTCSSCQSGYERNSANLCLVVPNRVQIILASIAKTWTMVAPNMAVLFLFVIFGVTRKLNASDRPFDLTGLRRANLSTVQVARRRQQSLFHPKYIPMRPAKSRSFANPHQPTARGPPAF